MKIFIITAYIFIFVASLVLGKEDVLDTGIHGLTWKSGPLSIVRELRLGTYQIVVSGFFSRSGWKFYLGDYEIPLMENGEFALQIPVNINNIRAEFFSRNGKGGVENEVIFIHLNDYFKTQERRERRASSTRQWFEKQLKDMSLNFALGTSLLSYNQTSLEPVSQAGITPKADLISVFGQNEWSWESSVYTSFFSSVKLFGADTKIGYELPLIEGKMAVYLFGGMYYATTFGSDTVGYSGIWGPLIYPALRTTFRNGSSLTVVGKYSPVLSGYLPMRLDNASATVGATYYFKPFSGMKLRGVPFGISLEATRLVLVMDRGDLRVTTYTLSGNLLF